MNYAIEIEHLSKEFTKEEYLFNFLPLKKRRDKKIVLKDINLQIKKGEFFGLLGPNGSGKTVLLKLLATLLLPTEGDVYVCGYNIRSNPLEVCRNIGFVNDEQRGFFWRLTGRQNLEFFAYLYGLSHKQTKKRINELVDLLEIGDYMDCIFYSYSKGIRQRFMFAKSLIHNPNVLLLDEPLNSLDTKITEQILMFIKKNLVYEQGKTVFFTAHDYNGLAGFLDRIAIIEAGIIKIIGTVEELELKGYL